MTLKGLLAGGFILVAFITGGLIIERFVDAQESGTTVSGPFLVSNRTTLSLCVEGSGDTANVDNIKGALDAALNRFNETRSAYTDYETANGCPPARALAGTPQTHEQRNGLFGPAKFIRGESDASPHRLFVYFVDPDEYVVFFGEEPYATSPEEILCELDQCTSITRGIYFASDTSGDVLEHALADVLNLIPATPTPEADQTAGLE